MNNNVNMGAMGMDPFAQQQFGMQPMIGYNFNQNQVPAYTNPLGTKRIEELLKNGNGAPKLQITQEDMDQAICTHRQGNQNMAYQLPNGKYKCKICGAEFDLVEGASQEDIQLATDNLWNIMQTAKMMWLDVPDNIARENFQVLAVVKQVPLIMSIATDRFNKYLGYNPLQQNNQVNGFAMLNNIMGQGMPMMGGMMPQQPMYAAPQNYPYGQGMMNFGGNYGQPMMQQPMQMQAAPLTPMQQQMVQDAPGMVNNGFGYQQAPAVNVQPNVQVQQTAQQPVDPAQNAQAPADNGGAQVTQQLHV